MTNKKLRLWVLPEKFAICRLDKDAAIPDWARVGGFFSITRASDELSIVCEQTSVPEAVRCEQGWRCLKVHGPLDFSLTGVLASLAAPLAGAGISMFAVSTYDTDYLLIKEADLKSAVVVLSKAGHLVDER